MSRHRGVSPGPRPKPPQLVLAEVTDNELREQYFSFLVAGDVQFAPAHDGNGFVATVRVMLDPETPRYRPPEQHSPQHSSPTIKDPASFFQSILRCYPEPWREDRCPTAGCGAAPSLGHPCAASNPRAKSLGPPPLPPPERRVLSDADRSTLQQYNSFCQIVGLPANPTGCKRRSLSWLLRLMDEIYDERIAVEKIAMALEADESYQLWHDPWATGRLAELREASFPAFVHHVMKKKFGLRALVEVNAVDLATAANAARASHPAVKVFSAFLSEAYDKEALEFFLAARRSTLVSLRRSAPPRDPAVRTVPVPESLARGVIRALLGGAPLEITAQAALRNHYARQHRRFDAYVMELHVFLDLLLDVFVKAQAEMRSDAERERGGFPGRRSHLDAVCEGDEAAAATLPRPAAPPPPAAPGPPVSPRSKRAAHPDSPGQPNWEGGQPAAAAAPAAAAPAAAPPPPSRQPPTPVESSPPPVGSPPASSSSPPPSAPTTKPSHAHAPPAAICHQHIETPLRPAAAPPQLEESPLPLLGEFPATPVEPPASPLRTPLYTPLPAGPSPPPSEPRVPALRAEWHVKHPAVAAAAAGTAHWRLRSPREGREEARLTDESAGSYDGGSEEPDGTPTKTSDSDGTPKQRPAPLNAPAAAVPALKASWLRPAMPSTGPFFVRSFAQ